MTVAWGTPHAAGSVGTVACSLIRIAGPRRRLLRRREARARPRVHDRERDRDLATDRDRARRGLLWGYRIWPGIALGAFLANAWTDVPLYTTLGITARQHRRGAGRRLSAPPPHRLPAVAGSGPRRRSRSSCSAASSAPWSARPSASAACCSATRSTSPSSAPTWRTWWLGDMGGDLVVAPALLVAVTHWPYRAGARAARSRPPRWPPLIAGVAALVFTQRDLAHLSDLPAADRGRAALLAAGRGRRLACSSPHRDPA